jgi:hypothetical protein
MNPPCVRRLAPEFCLSVVEPAPALDDALQRRVDDCWERACAAQAHLFDGDVLVLADIEGDEHEVRAARGHFVPFRRVVAQRAMPDEAALRMIGLGVSGLCHHGDAVLVGRRGSHVTHYPGAWELVPSGSISRRHVRADGTVDLRGQLLEELVEESGHGQAQLVTMTPRWWIDESAERIADLCFDIELRQKQPQGQGSDEYMDCAWMTPEVIDSSAMRDEPWVPTSRRLLHAWRRQRGL